MTIVHGIDPRTAIHKVVTAATANKVIASITKDNVAYVVTGDAVIAKPAKGIFDGGPIGNGEVIYGVAGAIKGADGAKASGPQVNDRATGLVGGINGIVATAIPDSLDKGFIMAPAIGGVTRVVAPIGTVESLNSGNIVETQGAGANTGHIRMPNVGHHRVLLTILGCAEDVTIHAFVTAFARGSILVVGVAAHGDIV